MPPPYTIPEIFVRNTIEPYGEAGHEWIARFPALLADLEQRWAIRILPPFELSYNYVAPAVRADGTEVVLKVGFINPELISEIAALTAYAGRGIVQLLDSLPEQGAMLLERIKPGVELASIADDDSATHTAAEVMQRLWIPAPMDPQQRLRQSRAWANGLSKLRPTFGGSTGPFPADLVERAEGLFADLFASAEPPMLLHGDLHHWNILSAERQPWLALDPKGLVGEAAYEIGGYMRNKFPEGEDRAAIQKQAARRLDIFHEVLGLNKERMLAWSAAQAILSAWWSYEDHHRVEAPMLFFARSLMEMAKE